ncbi:putative redox-active protein [Pelotomaculum schinkii]|uniref:Putative redox-active protein n=1 Tax=Pelotomaculum schinkii TaxID=78350 RepID=A0A4Y7R8L2_9FIRM|nr:C-GCAxxG-C-C family protein [Pelotomaculum schinkii]TEB05023.1 putative redox-active protein [Pelotomaculum schinkii]
MIDIAERVSELADEKYCCSQIVMTIGLEVLQKENEDLVKSMKGLCKGLYCQNLCGILSAAACVLSLHMVDYVIVLAPQLVDWFKKQYGSLNCSDLLEWNKSNPYFCMKMMTETIEYTLQLLEDSELLLEGNRYS